MSFDSVFDSCWVHCVCITTTSHHVSRFDAHDSPPKVKAWDENFFLSRIRGATVARLTPDQKVARRVHNVRIMVSSCHVPRIHAHNLFPEVSIR